MPAAPSDHPRVSLARFQSDIDEFLELAKTQPVILTSQGRERYVIADRDYFRHLERATHKMIAAQMNIEAVASFNLTAADKEAFAHARPSISELAKDRWKD